MGLSGHYDNEVGLLAMWVEKSAEGSCADCDWNLAVFVGTEDGHDVVGFEIITSGDVFLRMEEGYDPQTDTMTVGTITDDPALITENGDLVAYWRPDPEDPAGFMEPIGIAVRNAKGNLARVRVL